MANVFRYDSAGAGIGVYTVLYYTLSDGELRRQAGSDSNVSLGYVQRLDLAEDEIAVATCQSQPGGVTVYGSARVASAHRAMLDAERRELQTVARAAVAAVPPISGRTEDGREVTLSIAPDGYVTSTIECDLGALLRLVPSGWLELAQAARRAVIAAESVEVCTDS